MEDSRRSADRDLEQARAALERGEMDHAAGHLAGAIAHAPTLPETHHMIGARELALMPDGAVLINTARSWLVDSAALLEELRTGRIDAALDVFDEEPLPPDNPFRGLPNVLLTPHQAAATVECYFEMGEITINEIEHYASGRPLQYELTQAALARMA